MRKFIHKALCYTIAFQLSFSPLLASSFEDEVVARARPNRATSLIFTDPNHNRFTFEEYYLGSNGNDCFFNALGVTREAAIETVTINLARGSERTIELLDKAIEDQIQESAFAHLRGILPAERRNAYLNLYRTGTHMIECSQNIGNTAAVQDHTVTLFDVFAYVYRRNIAVYRPTPEAENILEAFHHVRYKECAQPTLHLLLKGSHFNRLLLPSHGLSMRAQALDEETRHLEALRLRVRYERAQEQIHTDQAEVCDDDLPPPLHCEMDASATPQNQPPIIDNTAPHNGQPRLSHNTTLEDKTLAHTHKKTGRITVSRDTVITFLLKKSASIPGLTYNQSRKNIWVALDQLPSLYERFAGKATLILDHDFIPHGQGRQETIQALIDRAPRSLSLEKEKHQIKIYLGRLLMEQRRFNEAWQTLTQTLENPKLSQVARLYMAQMIIEHGYRPTRLRDPIAYAQELLEASGEHTTTSNRAARSRPAATTTGYLHNPYLSERASLRTATSLAQMIQKDAHQGQQTTPRRELSRTSSSSSSSTSSTARSRPARTDISHTTPSPRDDVDMTHAPSNRVSQKRLQKEVTPSQKHAPQDGAEDSPTPKRSRNLAETHSPEHDMNTEETDAYITQDTPLFDALPRPPRITITSIQAHDEEDGAEDHSSPNPSQTLEHEAFSAYYARAKSLILQAKVAFMLGKNQDGTALCLDAFEMVDDANHLSAELNDTQRNMIRINAFLQLGNSQYSGHINGERVTRIECYLHALRLAHQLQDEDSQMRVFQGLGNASYNGAIDGIFYNRCDFYLRALALAKQRNDKEGQMRAFIGLGNISFHGMCDEKEHDPSDCYLRALELARELGDTSSQIRALMGLGNAHVDTKTPAVRQAKFTHFLQARDLAQRSGDREAQIRALHGMGFMSNVYACVRFYHEALNLCGDDFPELKASIKKNLDAAHKARAWQTRKKH